jgi:hypothetical protein
MYGHRPSNDEVDLWCARIKAFDPGLHDTRDFRCGSDSQDNVLRRTVKRQQRDGICPVSTT